MNKNISPRVCVVLASYNGSNYIEQQIDSILAQNLVDVELYIRDDGSTDGTVAILNKYVCDYDNVFLIENDGVGGSAGKNFYKLLMALDFIEKYDYVSFADQDDIWSVDKSIVSIQKIANEGADACSTNYHAFWDARKSVFVKKSYKQTQFDYIFESAGPGCTYTFSSELANAFRNFIMQHDEIFKDVFHHDWLLYSFARTNGFSWVFVDEALVEYRQHRSNETGVNIGLAAFKSRINKMRSGWFLSQVYVIANNVGYEDLLNKIFNRNKAPKLFYYINFIKFRRRLRDAMALALFLFFKIVR